MNFNVNININNNNNKFLDTRKENNRKLLSLFKNDYFRNLKELSIFPEDMEYVIQSESFPNLKSLTISYYKKILFKHNLDRSLSINNLSLLLSKAPQLKSLNLSYIQLQYFPFEIFEKHKNLEKLNLQYCELNNLEGIENLSNLIWLDFNHNKFKSFPYGIFKLNKLEYLNLSHTNIYEIPEEINNLSNLKEIDFSDNFIKEIPKSLFNLTNLESISFNCNQLTIIPKEITNLKNLKTFDVDFNEINILPKVIYDMKSLKELKIHSNKLNCIPKGICNLTELEYLDIDGNELQMIPFDEINNLKKLKTIYCNDEFSVKKFIDSNIDYHLMTTLDLSNKELTYLPLNIIKMDFNLKELDISHNHLTEISFSISKLKHLERLYLQGNPIEELPSFLWSMPYLELVLINGNLLSSIPNDFKYDEMKILTDQITTFLTMGKNKLPLNNEDLNQIKNQNNTYIFCLYINEKRISLFNH